MQRKLPVQLLQGKMPEFSHLRFRASWYLRSPYFRRPKSRIPMVRTSIFIQTDKSLSDDIQNALNNDIFLKAAVRNQITKYNTQNCTSEQCNKNLCSQSENFFYSELLLLRFFLSYQSSVLSSMYSFSDSFQSGISYTSMIRRIKLSRTAYGV